MLLEHMEHLHRFLEFGHKEHSIGPPFIPNTDFLDTRANRGHRLPVIRLLPLLDFEKLEPCRFTCTFWELPKVFP